MEPKEKAAEEEQPLTPEQRRILGIHLDALMAPVPNLKAIKEALSSIGDGIDPKQAYAYLLAIRPDDWTPLPTYEELMGK